MSPSAVSPRMTGTRTSVSGVKWKMVSECVQTQNALRARLCSAIETSQVNEEGSLSLRCSPVSDTRVGFCRIRDSGAREEPLDKNKTMPESHYRFEKCERDMTGASLFRCFRRGFSAAERCVVFSPAQAICSRSIAAAGSCSAPAPGDFARFELDMQCRPDGEVREGRGVSFTCTHA